MAVRSIHGVCEICGSQTWVHLVVRKDKEQDLMQLFCTECLAEQGLKNDTAVIEVWDMSGTEMLPY